MAYNPVAQADRDILSEGSNSVASDSPLPDNNSFRPISMEFENLGVNLMSDVSKGNEDVDTRLGSLMRSLASTGTSYDMLEDDDYEDTQETPVKNQSGNLDLDASLLRPQPHSSSLKGTARVRTASIGPKLPLRHPTPDLQSVQGAYIKNVERLEESAERLSMTSSLEDELQKMKFEQRRGQRQSSAPVGHTPALLHTSRHISASSLSNSIVDIDTPAQSNAHSSSQHVTSPKGGRVPGSWTQSSHLGRQTSKGSRFAQALPDHDIGGTPSNNARQHVYSCLEPPQPPPHTYQPENHARKVSAGQPHKHNAGQPEEFRPSTSASNDTYRQATTLFVDFDGVHYASHSHLSPSRQVSMSRQVAINQPPLAADAAAFDVPPLGEGMVYYPAPVPMMLNLPQKLSKQPSPAERERRRLRALSTMPSEVRKSAAWLSEMEKGNLANGTRTSQALSSLPPQLRASAFFDQPGLGQDIKIKCASAVDTLDSILDASAYAPVSAFTDHPFVGHLGDEVYGAQKGHRNSITLERKKKRRSSISNMLRTSTGITSDLDAPRPAFPAGLPVISLNKLSKESSRTDMNEGENAFADEVPNPLRTRTDLDNAVDDSAKPMPGEEEGEESEGTEGENEDEGEVPEMPAYAGPPTTLLAELQMRKAKQKLRNRTAANSFPNGMHSTLLELDAVAQLQQRSRNKKHITLAWEDQVVGDPTEFDDDDVPLGLLVAGQKAQQKMKQPMGLMEKRDMEDNEPLSKRRARLRGDDVKRPVAGPGVPQRASTMYTLDVPTLTDAVLEEDEGETLAQRSQRIKAEQGTATGLGSEIGKEVSSQVGLKTENVVPTALAPDGEETLGQRRKRLQEAGLKNALQPSGGSGQNVLGVKPRSSMADILSQHPAAGARQSSSESKGLALHDNPQIHMSTFQQPMVNSHMVPGMMPSYPPFNTGMPYMNGMSSFNYNNAMMYSPGLAMQMGAFGQNTSYLHDPIMMGPPLDPKQRDMIDRWRQGVAP